ncbi:hypothetical protein C8R47DRAFT_1210475 [Mycena vitilis]|nr:hypothetical protein C8R47DRAFT_1210475 [Mycena vitilis]
MAKYNSALCLFLFPQYSPLNILRSFPGVILASCPRFDSGVVLMYAFLWAIIFPPVLTSAAPVIMTRQDAGRRVLRDEQFSSARHLRVSRALFRISFDDHCPSSQERPIAGASHVAAVESRKTLFLCFTPLFRNGPAHPPLVFGALCGSEIQYNSPLFSILRLFAAGLRSGGALPAVSGVYAATPPAARCPADVLADIDFRIDRSNRLYFPEAARRRYRPRLDVELLDLSHSPRYNVLFRVSVF